MGDDGKKGLDTRERVRKKLRDNWLQGLKVNWTVWPGVQLVNFRFVPLEHRVLVVNLVSLGELSLPWCVCIGWIEGGRANDGWERFRMEFVSELLESAREGQGEEGGGEGEGSAVTDGRTGYTCAKGSRAGAV